MLDPSSTLGRALRSQDAKRIAAAKKKDKPRRAAESTADAATRAKPPVKKLRRAIARLPRTARALGGARVSDTWRPTAGNRRRAGWQIGARDRRWSTLEALQAPAGVTALAGQMLKLNGQPLAHVSVSIDGTDIASRTDATGRFLLTSVPPGHQVLVVDGTSANHAGRRYGTFEIGVNAERHQTVTLRAPVWMTALDRVGDHRVESPTRGDSVLTTPRIPGLEVRLPAGTTMRSKDGKAVRELNISQVPVDRPPFPLPASIRVPTYFTVQPGRVYLSKGAQIVYPNYGDLPPRPRVSFWNYDAHGKGWYIYGHGSVTANGKQVMPDKNVRVWEFTGAMISSNQAPPAHGPKPFADLLASDPVDLGTGLFVHQRDDISLPGAIGIGVKRTYRPGDPTSYSFGVGATSAYDMRLWTTDEDNYQDAQIVLPDGGTVHLTRTSPGGDYWDAEYTVTDTPGEFYGARMTFNEYPWSWDLTTQDGTTYNFMAYGPLQSITDRWGNRVTLTRDNWGEGNVTQVTGPGGRWIRFEYDDANRVTTAQDNGGRQVSYDYDAGGRLHTVTDPRGDVTTYTYDAAGQMTDIENGRGDSVVHNDYDANGRVTHQQLGDGAENTFAYQLNDDGNVTQTRFTAPSGAVRELHFNARGSVTQDIDDADGPDRRVINYQRDADTDLVNSMTEAGRLTTYTYDDAGNVLHQTVTAGGQTRTTSNTFTADGKLLTSTDAAGRTSSYRYDKHNRLIEQTTPQTGTTNYSYNGAGWSAPASTDTGG